MESKQVEVMMLYISVGMKVLSARIILLLTLMLVFSLFSWAMYDPSYQRIGCATLFAILVFLPVIRIDAKQSEGRKIISPQGDENG